MSYIHSEIYLKELKGTKPLKSSIFRNERKFRVYTISYSELLNIIHLNPFLFREIYYQRTINNIYLDSLELDSFFDNVDGYSKRMKVRVRWYGDDLTEVISPKLEFKIKYGHVGTKRVFPLKPFAFGKGFSKDQLTKSFDNSNLPDVISEAVRYLHLSVLNKYQRRYFISLDGRFRITLDKNMQYYLLRDSNNSFLTKRSEDGVSVLELKYNISDDSDANKIVKQFNFRMTKNSKYVSGASYYIHTVVLI